MMGAKEIIVVCGNTVVRVPPRVWDEIMIGMAGQMEDDYMEYAKSCGVPKAVRDQTLPLFQKLRAIGANE